VDGSDAPIKCIRTTSITEEETLETFAFFWIIWLSTLHDFFPLRFSVNTASWDLKNTV
jgi:hypothetical protein